MIRRLYCGSGLIIKNHKILLVQRSYKKTSFPRYWGAIGGGKKDGETLTEACIREVKEETNLIFNPIKLFDVIKHTLNDFEIKIYRFLGQGFGDIILNDEAIQYEWCDYQNAINKNLCFNIESTLNKLLCQRYIK